MLLRLQLPPKRAPWSSAAAAIAPAAIAPAAARALAAATRAPAPAADAAPRCCVCPSRRCTRWAGRTGGRAPQPGAGPGPRVAVRAPPAAPRASCHRGCGRRPRPFLTPRNLRCGCSCAQCAAAAKAISARHTGAQGDSEVSEVRAPDRILAQRHRSRVAKPVAVVGARSTDLLIRRLPFARLVRRTHANRASREALN